MLRNPFNTVCRSVAMIVLVCFFVGMTGASESHQQFHYQNTEIVRRDNDACKICYGMDCLEMDHLRCDYYMLTDKLLQEATEEKVNNPEISGKVDDMMHSFIEKASEISPECIPFVSSYTDCHKENICTGCRSCACDTAGRWRCNIIQKCRADLSLDISHRVLVTVIENLMNNDQRSRLKRSVKDKGDANATKMSYKEISEWLFDVQPLVDQLQRTTTDEIAYNFTDSEVLTKPPIAMEQSVTNNIIIPSSKPNTIIDHDYLAFDEVLNSIAVESKNYSRKKPLAYTRNDTFFDYMLFDEFNETVNNLQDKDEFLGSINTLDVDNNNTSTNIKGVTEVVIDLLEPSQRNNIGDELNITDYMEDNERNNYLDPVMENNNYLELNAVNIMRRDIAIVNSSKLNVNEDNNNTSGTIELKDDVLLPLSNLISAKQKELDDLLRISDSLIKFMKLNNTDDNIIDRDNETDINSSFNIYKLEFVPENDYNYDLRRTNTNIIQKMLYKLKRDVYEVIRDMVTIQKLTNFTQLPQDMKILIRAMKSYVRSQKNDIREENKSNVNDNIYFRRHLDDENPIIHSLINIFEVVAKNNAESTALAPLSDTSRKILKRVIKQNYVSEFTESGLKVFDVNYNLTNDLQSIGAKWQEFTKYVTESTVFDRLYAMKLLHFLLSSDTEKINDALTFINFAHSRRMTTIDGSVGDKIIEKINKGLQTISDKIKLIIKLHKKGFESNNSTKSFELHKKLKKESFFKKIRNALRNSKKDIVGLLKRNAKKKDLVKKIVKNKLDDITRRRFTEFEETMKKWQNNLDLTPRGKRSLRNIKHNNRIKNILPKYLRGKVNPAITAKDIKKINSRHNKKKIPKDKIRTNTARTVLQSSKTTMKNKA